MQAVMDGYRGLRLVVGLNWDRVFFFGTLLVGLLAGAFLGNVLSGAGVIQDLPGAF
jgi:cytochrome bd-type quinol oxidase subunit 2